MKAGDRPTRSRSNATTTAKHRQAPKAARDSRLEKTKVENPATTEADRRDQGSTGLGLHIVHNIVTNRLGSRINLETTPGAGTKIRIVVPREAPFGAE